MPTNLIVGVCEVFHLVLFWDESMVSATGNGVRGHSYHG